MRAVLLLAGLLVACGGSSDGSTENQADSSIDAMSDSAVIDTGADARDDARGDAIGDATDETTRLDADASPPSTTPIVYVATGDGKISTFDLDETSGKLTPKSSFAAGNYPSFLAFDAPRLRVFAVLEPSGLVAAFSMAKGSGALTPLGTPVSSPGTPTFVSLDGGGAHVLVADYSAGTTDVFALNADGSLGARTDHQAPGNLAHQFVVDPTNAFAFAPCKGSDLVAQFRYDATKGTMTPNGALTTSSGAGPRHLAFDPSGKHAYLIDELDSTMQALDYDASKGSLTHVQTLSTLPSGFDPTKNTGAEVQVAPSGKFVFGSNRGHDSIVAFSLAADGTMTLVGHTPTGGKTPRHFSLADTGALLFVANQDSSNVVTFSVDAGGALKPLGTTATSASPYWVGLVRVPK